ncbi:MAG: hypothetical protein ABIH23_30330 [bacterium]
MDLTCLAFGGNICGEQAETMMMETIHQQLDHLMARVKSVRRWLLATALLKMVALCFGWVGVYAGAYIWLDHSFHIGVTERVLALVFFVVSTIYLVLKLSRSFVRHLSYSQVANYIESRVPLEQQLVTAVEYREQDQNYPYSRALADYLVGQVDRACADLDFQSTISKWRAYLFSALVFCGTVFATLFILNNMILFSRYMQRLIQPLATIEPLPATRLESVSKDLIVAPDKTVTLAAEIRGRVPDAGNLILEASPTINPTGAQNAKETENIPVYPSRTEDSPPQLQKDLSFSPGEYRYRFEAGEAMSSWHHIAVVTPPMIASLKAEITLPGTTKKPKLTQEIENNRLRVYRDAHVKVTAKTTAPIDVATLTGINGEPLEATLKTLSSFSFEFDALEEGVIRFQLTNADGLTNSKLPGLQVVLQEDQPPSIELNSPGGDYVAANVASIPITFTVQDDCGLDSGKIVIQVAGLEPLSLPFRIERGVQRATYTYVLELEEYDLNAGDSVLYYAEATDVNSGMKAEASTCTTDIYLIEIRPYRQIWHPNRASMPGSPDQAAPPDPSRLHDNLKSVLEYSRAILKKTWAIAGRDSITDEDRRKMDSIRSDVEYAADQVSMIRDDPYYPLTWNEISALNTVLGNFDDAGSALAGHDPKAAVGPETKAYQALRKLLIETDRKLCPPGGTPERPDRLILDENVHLTRYEQEKAKDELERLADQLQQLRSEQEQVNRRFDHFLAQSPKMNDRSQATTDEKAWISDEDAITDSTSTANMTNLGQQRLPSFVTLEGAISPDLARAQPSAGCKACAQERLQVFQAKEKSLQERLRELAAQLDRLATKTQAVQSDESRSQYDNAKEHLDSADKRIQEFLNQTADTFFQTENTESLLRRSREALDQAEKALACGVETVENMPFKDQEDTLEKEYERVAGELRKLADKFQENPDSGKKREMVAALKAAEQFYQSTPESRSPQMSQSTQSGQQSGGGGGPQNSNQDSSAIFYGYWDWDGLEPGEAARFLAMAFQSLAIAADEKETEWIDKPPSDADFYQLEKEFYETAARFDER